MSHKIYCRVLAEKNGVCPVIKTLDADGAGADRRWTFSGVIDCLQSRRRHTVCVNEIEFKRDEEETAEQKKIMTLLKT